METTTQYRFLAPKPGSAYRQLFIKGRKISARDVYGMFMSAEEPRSVEEIAADYDLPIEAVQEAIAYCRTNPPEIEADFRREERFMEAMGTNDPVTQAREGSRRLSAEEIARILRS